jgi:DNA polymerase
VQNLPKMPTKPPPPPPKFKSQPPLQVKPLRHHFPRSEGYAVPARAAGLPEWLAVLRECGKPEVVLVIDFETYFDEEYKMMGKGEGLSTVEYITDSRFEIIGCSFLTVKEPFPDYEGTTFFQAGEEMVATQIKLYQKLYGDNLEGCTVVIQNGTFDATILALRFGIYPPHVIDTLALARAWNSRSKNDLDTQTKRWGLPAKGDTTEFKGLTFRKRFKKPKGRKKGPKLPFQVPLITVEQIAALRAYTDNDVMREWELFTLLLPRLSRPAFELRVMQLTLEMFTKPTLSVDFEKGKELIVLMEAEIDKVMVAAGVVDTEEKTAREQISGDKTFEAMLFDALGACGDSPIRYIKYGKNNQALLAIAKDDPQRKELQFHADEHVRNLMAARLALDSWPLHIRRVERIMGQARAGGGRLHVPLKYHGAHTGRDSGGEKINLQNLGARGHALISAIREMLIAVIGFKVVIVDLAGIEARVTGWIAGQESQLIAYREQDANPDATTDQYTKFATDILGWPVRKPKKERSPGYIKAIEARHKFARNSIGKIPTLGVGYGLGTDRLVEILKEANVPGTDAELMELAERIKTKYRDDNEFIVRFWKDVERAFIYTAKYKRSCELPRGLRFDSAEDCDVVITLPSGREIHYVRVRIVEGKYGEAFEVYNETEHCWKYAWGGVLTENIVQAIARDILMEAMIDLDEQGYKTSLRVHDELVIVERDDQAEACLNAALTAMRKVPVWAPGLPLNAEGVIRQQYGGH